MNAPHVDPVFQFEEKLHFLLSKKSVKAEIAMAFSHALYEMEHSGEIEQILNAYGIQY